MRNVVAGSLTMTVLMVLMRQSLLDGGADMLRLKLALAQLYLYQEHIYKACDVLWSLGDLSYSPGVVRPALSLSYCRTVGHFIFHCDQSQTLRLRPDIRPET